MRIARLARSQWHVHTAIFAVILVLGACGATSGEASTPTPATAVPTPTLAEVTPSPATAQAAPSEVGTAAVTPTATPRETPTPTPRATPTPEVVARDLGPDDFDADRFARDVAQNPPDVLRISATSGGPGGVGQALIVLSARPADDFAHVLFDVELDERRVVLELITAGDRVYLRGEVAGEQIDWLAATVPEGESSPLDALPGADAFSVEALQRDWRAIAVEPCRAERTCFVLQNSVDPEVRLYIDTDTYLPLLFLGEPEDGEAPTEVEIDWNASLDVEIPTDAEEVTTDELGVAVLLLLLSLAPPEATATAAPTAAPSPTPAAVPEVAPEGRGRSNPYAFDTVMEAPDWRFEALETIRGDEAWELIQEANQFNDPAAESREYVLVRIRAIYVGDDEADIHGSDFRITGSSGWATRAPPVSEPEPELDATLRPTGETEGWVAFEVGQGETDLMLIYDPFFAFDEETQRFLALESDARVVPDWEAFPQATAVGVGRARPALPGESASNSAWELTVLEILRGDAALQAVVEANPFNEAPPDGSDFVLVKIRARNITRVDAVARIDKFALRLTGDEAVLYQPVLVVDPIPPFDFDLSPGGVADGWTTFQATSTDTGLMLRFEPFLAIDETDVRYLALNPDAGIEPPAGPLAEATDLGTTPETAVPLGQTATTDAFEIRVFEVVRGDDALAIAREATQFNDDPDVGMEYVQVRVRVRNISGEDAVRSIRDFEFRTLGDRANIWDTPLVSEPEPALQAELYPGGMADGWVTLQAAEGETGLMLVYAPTFEPNDANRRYLNLE